MKKVKFLKSPVGLGFAYCQHEEAEINENQANEFIELGYAVEIIEETAPVEKAVKPAPKNVEKAVK